MIFKLYRTERNQFKETNILNIILQTLKNHIDFFEEENADVAKQNVVQPYILIYRWARVVSVVICIVSYRRRHNRSPFLCIRSRYQRRRCCRHTPLVICSIFVSVLWTFRQSSLVFVNISSIFGSYNLMNKPSTYIIIVSFLDRTFSNSRIPPFLCYKVNSRWCFIVHVFFYLAWFLDLLFATTKLYTIICYAHVSDEGKARRCHLIRFKEGVQAL